MNKLKKPNIYIKGSNGFKIIKSGETVKLWVSNAFNKNTYTSSLYGLTTSNHQARSLDSFVKISEYEYDITLTEPGFYSIKLELLDVKNKTNIFSNSILLIVQ